MLKISPEDVERKLSKARTQLLLGQPFFGTLCVRLKMVPGTVETTATDGRQILYNPEFVAKLSARELEGVVAHDVLHCALAHHCRRGQRDAKLWNDATDYAINPMLVANGFTLPAGALIDSSYNDLSAEEIYARLARGGGNASNSSSANPASSMGSGAGSGGEGKHSKPKRRQQPDAKSEDSATASDPQSQSGGFGEVLDATDEEGNLASEAGLNLQANQWDVAADQALRAAIACGRQPLGMERSLSKNRESNQDWRAILRDFVISATPTDFSWFPPNRRYVGAGIYLPSLRKTGMGEIVIAVDTSGSIGEKELEQFAGEISSIADEVKPEAIHVVYCDTKVQRVDRFEESEPIQLAAKGGGGTDFKPPFTWVEETDIVPAAFIYLTDLCCNSYPEPPGYRVLWVTTSTQQAPFGETVQIAIE